MKEKPKKKKLDQGKRMFCTCSRFYCYVLHFLISRFMAGSIHFMITSRR